MADDISWPVVMVDGAGNRVEVHSVLEAHEAALAGGCRLVERVPGLNLAVAAPARSQTPRSLPGDRRPDDPPPVSEHGVEVRADTDQTEQVLTDVGRRLDTLDGQTAAPATAPDPPPRARRGGARARTPRG